MDLTAPGEGNPNHIHILVVKHPRAGLHMSASQMATLLKAYQHRQVTSYYSVLARRSHQPRDLQLAFQGPLLKPRRRNPRAAKGRVREKAY